MPASVMTNLSKFQEFMNKHANDRIPLQPLLSLTAPSATKKGNRTEFEEGKEEDRMTVDDEDFYCRYVAEWSEDVTIPSSIALDPVKILEFMINYRQSKSAL